MMRTRQGELQSFVSKSPIRREAIRNLAASVGRDLPDSSRMLDVGAGRAPYRQYFSHCDYSSLDWSNSPHDTKHDYVGDLARGVPAVATASFDCVLCTEVLEHVLHVGAALNEVHRILRPGGIVAGTVPFVMPLHEEPFDFWRPTSYALTQLLRESRFEDIEVVPSSGLFGTACEFFIDSIDATRGGTIDNSVPFRVGRKATQLLGRSLANFCRDLDALDSRKALPVGWEFKARASAI